MSLPVFVLSCSAGTVRDDAMRRLLRGADASRVTAIVPGRRLKRRRARTREGVTLISTRKRLVRMGQGCSCCTVRGDLLPKVRDIARKGQAGALLIHEPPQADLGVLAKTFTVPDSKGAVLAEDARIQALIAVVGVDQLRLGTRGGPSRQLVERIELAQVVLLDTGGRPRDGRVSDAELLVRALNPDARVMAQDSEHATLSGLGGDAPFDLQAAQQRSELQDLLDAGGSQTAGRVTRIAFLARRPFHPQRLHTWLEAPPQGLVRARGSFWVASRPHLAATLDLAPGDSHTEVAGHWWAAVPQGDRPTGPAFEAHLREVWDPTFGDRRQELAFVGIDLGEAELTSSLEACLLTDAELTEPERWSSGPHPFRWKEPHA